MIEEVSGRSFQDYMKAEVFQPLGMNTSQYGLPHRYEQVMAVPYGAFGEPLARLRYNELSAAGLTTSLRDLAALAAAGLKGPAGAPPGRGILRTQTIELMQSPSAGSRWADRDLFGPSPHYGLGYTVRPAQFAGRNGVGHGGSNRGWESFFQIVPSTGDGIVLMTNSSTGNAVISAVLCSWRKWASGSGASVECPKIDIRSVLPRVYLAKGARAAVDRYRELRRSQPNLYDFSAHQLNSIGYELLRRGDISGGIEIFRLNAEQFPQDWNVHDSLGEALLKAGEEAHAIKSYRRSLDLNPDNDNGRNMLRSLGVQIPQ